MHVPIDSERRRNGCDLVAIALIVLTFMAAFLMLVLTSGTSTLPGLHKSVIGVAWLLLMVFIFVGRWRWNKRKDLQDMLKKVEQLLGEIFTQELVDAVLERLALAFHEVKEERAQYAGDAAREDKDAVRKFDELETVVLEKRRVFWEMYAFFDSLGSFRMYKSFKDYLPKELRDAYKPKRHRHRRPARKAAPAAAA